MQQPVIPSRIYCYILGFLTSQPTEAQIAAFKPTPEMVERLQTLLSRSQAGELTATELAELDEYERIEHLMGCKPHTRAKLGGGSFPRQTLRLLVMS